MASFGSATARLAGYSIIFIGTVLTILFTTDHPVTLSAPVKVGRLEVGLNQGVPTRSNGPADYGGRNALLVICFDKPGKTSMLSGCRVTLASFRRSNSDDDIIVIAPSRDYVGGLSELKDRLGLKFEFVGLGPYQCRIQQDCKQLPLFSYGNVHHYDYQQKGKFTGNALRHVWYDEVMSRVGDSYDRLLIADGKDVYFQADPFSISTRLGQPCREKVCLFSEPRNDRMAKFFVKKTREISHCLSQKQREYVMEKRRGGYANGGVLLGSAAHLQALCRSVVAKANECDFWQADQHYVNIVISMLDIPFHLFEDGTFGTMVKTNVSGWRSWRTSSSGWLQSTGPLAGRTPLSFVHQYQWSEDLKKFIEADVGAWLHNDWNYSRC